VTRARILRFALLACVVVGLAWVRQLPLQAGLVELSDPELARILAEQDDEIRYLAPDGRQHVYLGRLDSYLWLGSARNLLEHGTPCDAIVDGKCRNTFSHAPVGRPMFYARSLHPRAIAALHSLITAFAPEFPLPSTAFWVQVLLGAACALPAFAIGRALAGDVGGFAAAIVVGLNPIFLDRSIGGDNDVWQVLLPLCMVWAAVRALLSERSAGALAFAAVAGLAGGLHAADWSGWIFAWAALLCGLIATALLQAVVRRSGRP
jgi:asparagine N-glycosylation enzyme membrane subunit Stt3